MKHRIDRSAVEKTPNHSTVKTTEDHDAKLSDHGNAGKAPSTEAAVSAATNRWLGENPKQESWHALGSVHDEKLQSIPEAESSEEKE